MVWLVVVFKVGVFCYFCKFLVVWLGFLCFGGCCWLEGDLGWVLFLVFWVCFVVAGGLNICFGILFWCFYGWA